MPLLVALIAMLIVRLVYGRKPGDQRAWWPEGLAFGGTWLVTACALTLLL